MTTAIVLAFSMALAPQVPEGLDTQTNVVIETTLSRIREHPDAFREVRVSFPVQFASLGRVHNPFFTRFVPSEYANFYGWADEQPIWQRTEYDDVFGQMFLSKENHQLQQLYEVKLYERLQVEGVVRNTFQGTPWIEITSFSLISPGVTTATLAHLYRGEDYMNKRQWQRAISEFQKANTGSAPEMVAYGVHRQLGVCYLRIGEANTAVGHLQTAVGSKHSDYELQQLLSAAKNSPSLELDTTVNETEVKDYQRPMWEAFEGVIGDSSGTERP